VLEIVQAEADARALALAGELDLATVPILLERAASLSDADGDVTLELADLSFVDSQGIRAFIRIAGSLEGRGRLVLAHPSPEVRKLFEIVRVRDFPNMEIDA
jgi:anti-anti-sigma factor